MSFDTSQRLEGYRGGQPHTTAGASTKLALVDLNAEIDAVFRIFRSENDHNVVCLQDHYTTFLVKCTQKSEPKVTFFHFFRNFLRFP